MQFSNARLLISSDGSGHLNELNFNIPYHRSPDEYISWKLAPVLGVEQVKAF